MALQQKAYALELGLLKLQSNNPSKNQIDSLDREFEDVYMDLQPTSQDYQARKTAVDFVNDLARDKLLVADVRKRHGGCNARAFGSFTMDMFTSTSDLDISLNVDSGSESLTRQDGVNLLKKLTKLLYKLQSIGVVQDIQPVFKAKIPVVKFIHCNTGVECDVSVENRDGIVKSELLRIFSSIDSRFRKFCFLLKAWANAHGINSSKDHTLNSLSLILLAALHLQTRVPAILPPFSILMKGVNSSTASHAASLVERQVNAYKDFGKKNSETVVQLFNSFLTKIMAVKDLWQEGLCASAYEGTWTLTTSPSWIFVEDFTSLSQNAARAVNGVGFEAIYECCKQTSTHLEEFFLGILEAQSLKTLLFELHISSAVHKRKRKKEGQQKAISYQAIQGVKEDPFWRSYRPIQGTNEDPFLRLHNSRPHQIPAQIRGNPSIMLGRDYMTQVGHSSIQDYVVPTPSTGLLEEHPARRLKSQHARYGEDYMPAFIDRQPLLSDKSVMLPSQGYLERHLREEQHFHSYAQRRPQIDERRPQISEPRSYMQPVPTTGMYERRHVLGDRIAEVAYPGARGFVPPPQIPRTSSSLYAESLRGRNPIDLVPSYGYGLRLIDRSYDHNFGQTHNPSQTDFLE